MPVTWRVPELHARLLARFGPQGWWPARGEVEMMVGAVLVQNTAWQQAAKVVAALDERGLLDFAALRGLPEEQGWELLRPAGFFRQKMRRLQALARFFAAFDDSPARFFALPGAEQRLALLGIHGIGPETADSILCYGARLPLFVVDAYTWRLWERLGWAARSTPYAEMQRRVQEAMPAEAAVLGELHALIVALAKAHCLSRPRCQGCPVDFCPYPSGGVP
ncbi:MAG: hypothetical protein HQL56_16550 [Magnetococcales bacterium]|nr:hypothetical protein [Magnetococcales bacterium]